MMCHLGSLPQRKREDDEDDDSVRESAGQERGPKCDPRKLTWRLREERWGLGGGVGGR